MARWLWNVAAVSRWEELRGNPNSNLPAPEWWSQGRENKALRRSTRAAGELKPFDRFIGGFVGQGRQIGYNGLAYAVISSVYDGHSSDRRMHSTLKIATEASKHLGSTRPGSWWILSLTTLSIVWLEVGMAIMLSYNTPTVGLACRSGSYLIFGVLSTIPWIFQCLSFFKRPGFYRKSLCHFASLLSNISLIFITFAAVSLLNDLKPVPGRYPLTNTFTQHSSAVCITTVPANADLPGTWTLRMPTFTSIVSISTSLAGG